MRQEGTRFFGAIAAECLATKMNFRKRPSAEGRLAYDRDGSVGEPSARCARHSGGDARRLRARALRASREAACCSWSAIKAFMTILPRRSQRAKGYHKALGLEHQGYAGARRSRRLAKRFLNGYGSRLGVDPRRVDVLDWNGIGGLCDDCGKARGREFWIHRPEIREDACCYESCQARSRCVVLRAVRKHVQDTC